MFNFGKKNSQEPTADNNDTKTTDDQMTNDSSQDNSTQQPASNDSFSEKPLNQIVTDPESWQTITRWKCSKCKFQYEGTSNPDKCPNCGAGREFFMEIG